MKIEFWLMPLLGFSLTAHAISVTDGLVAHYELNGNAEDSSGNGLHGTIVGVPHPTTDRFGNQNSAYGFNGGSDSIRLSGLNLQTGIGEANTVSFWMNWNGQVTGEHGSYPFAWGTPDAAYGIFFQNQAALRFGVAGGHGDVWGVNFDPAQVDNWIHVAVVFKNGSTVLSDLYVNGILQSSDMTFAGNPSDIRLERTVGNEAIISGYLDSTDRFRFFGAIDEVAIYNRALSADEIGSLYSVPEGSPRWVGALTIAAVMAVGTSMRRRNSFATE